MLDFFSGVIRLFDMTFNAVVQDSFFAFLIYTMIFLLCWCFFWFMARSLKRL